MARINTRGATARPGRGPVVGESTPSGRTFEGAPGYARDVKSELFLLAVSTFHGEAKFYETANDVTKRYVALVREAAVVDPDWTANFLKWLREEANIRTAAIVGAAEYAWARRDERGTGRTGTVHPAPALTVRQVVASVLRRPDEPGEFVAYWRANHQRSLPGGVQRGVADAVARLYGERSLLKYDTESHGYRFGDVIDLVHPVARSDWQGDLFQYALDRRHRRDNEIPGSLLNVRANAELREHVARGNFHRLLDALALREAGMTWEDVLSLGGKSLDKRRLWEAVIPSMGYMALLRNLRNFDEAGVSDDVAQRVAAKLADPEEVRASRQFPFRFWSAYRNVKSLRWSHTLEKALNHSLANVPSLGGRTLILVDRSPSMFPGFHFSTPNKSEISLADQAAVFGAALALRAVSPTLVEFGGQSRPVGVSKGGSVLRLVEQFTRIDGTDIPTAVRTHLAGHDRIIVVTDEQTRAGYLPSNMHFYGGARETLIDDLVPAHVPLYMWNMAGYKYGATPAGKSNRHTLGGLTDAAFRLIPLLEAGRDARWPWE